MNKKIKLPVSDIATEYLQGASLRELGEKYSVDHTVIYERLISLGIETKKRRGGIECDFLHEKYKKMSIRNLADDLNISEGTVYKLLRKCNIKTRRNHPPRMIHKKILEEWEQTHNISQVSMKLDVAYNTVKKVLRANDKLNKGKGDRHE